MTHLHITETGAFDFTAAVVAELVTVGGWTSCESVSGTTSRTGTYVHTLLCSPEGIYYLFRVYSDTSTGRYNLELRMGDHATYNPGTSTWELNTPSPAHYMLLWEHDIIGDLFYDDYGFRLVAKVANFYEQAYADVFDATENSTDYPKPYAIGASWSSGSDTAYSPDECEIAPRWGWWECEVRRWGSEDSRNDSARHRAYFNGCRNLSVLLPDGTWQYVTNVDTAGVPTPASTSSFALLGGDISLDQLAGDTPLSPLTIVGQYYNGTTEEQVGGCLGQLRHVRLVNNTDSVTPGSEITVGADTHLAIPNVVRTDANNFIAYWMG